MRKLLICQLEPDMVLAETVFAPDNRVLLAEGTLLTENLIKRLDKMEISEICVNDEDTISIDPDQVLINRVYTMALPRF
ncbi:MAG: hypothetical protein RO469_08455 [Thermincola sp.]|jgi:formate dehydrogenase assembly factor FdhD|nr:hypothetical protein [Thermincola sp.]MDT3703582.1 hypothetical protein [Thermincola sp.]